MTVTCSEIYKTSFCYDIDLVAVLQSVTGDILSCRLDVFRDLTKTCDIYFAVEMSCVTADCAILHLEEMILYDDCVTACHCHEDISYRSCLLHLHYLESVHHSLHRLDRIHLSDNHFRTKALRSHSNTFTAPSITCHYDILTCNDKVGSTVDTVPN